MAIFTLEDLRNQVSEEYASKSDEELVLDYARGTGQDPFKVASKFGVKTGMGRSAFTSGASAGVDQVQSMAAGAGAAVAEALGATGLRNTLESEVRSQQAQAALAINPEVPQRIEDVESVSDFGSYFAGQVGQQVPVMGGIAAAGALTGGLGLGAGVGSLAAGYTYGVGSLYNESVEAGERDAAGALLGGIPYAAAEAAVPYALGRAVRGLGVPGVSATREINLAGGGATATVPTTALGRGGKALVGGAVAEGATEAFQTELEIGMRDDLSPEEIASRRLNAVVSGALIGGGFSGAVNAAFKPKDAKPTEKDISTPNDILQYKEQYIEEQRRLRSKPILTEEQLDEQVEAIAADTNGLEELEKLAKQRMNSREREATRLELKAAQEKLAELNQSIPESEELFSARERLAKLEAESSPDIGKRTRGREAAKLRKQAEQRAQETAEERRDLEIAIASMEFDLRNEYSEQGAQLFALEYHIDKLRDTLEVDARGKAARKALVRVRKGKLTPEQGQAQVEQAEADRQASLEAASQPIEEAAPVTTVVTEQEQEQAPTVEPTSPIVEPSPDEMFTVARDVGGVNLVEDVAYGDLTAEEKASRPVQDEIKRRAAKPTAEPVAEPRGEVVQTTTPEEELVTEEEIEAAEVADAEKEAQSAAPKLQAAVRSEDRKADGRLTMSQPLIAAVARHLRAVTVNGFKKVYKQGGAIIDDKATADASEFLDQVRAKYHEIIRLSDVESNLTQNAGSIKEGNVGEFEFDSQSLDAIDQQARALNLPSARSALKQALNEFVDLVGGETNANAINAVIKKLNYKKYDADTKGISDKMDYARSTFGVDEKGSPRRKQTTFNSKADFTKEADVAFSSALRRYINGELDENADIAPKGRSVRPSLERQARIKKARDAGVELTEEELQAGAEQGGSAYGRTDAQIEDSYARAVDRYETKLQTIEDKFAEGKISQKQYESQMATAERDMQKAELSRRRQYERREQSKGLEGVVIRALGKGDRTITGKMLRKAISTILRKIPKTDHPTFSFADVKESSYNPTKGNGGHITFRRAASPEEVAHEVLHSLLQGIVYRNSDPNKRGVDKDIAATINVLRGYVQQLITADLSKVNLDAQTKQKASEVVSKLRELVNRGGNGEVDAILELISYGNTMRDFKQLLTKLPKTRNAETANWKAVLRGIWKQIQTMLNIALGNDVHDTAANDILDASVDLLNRVSEDVTRARPQKKGARVLKQSVRSDSVPLNGTANPADFNIDLRNEVAGKDWVLSSKVVFDLLGWDKRMKWGGERLTELNTYIKKNLPWVETFIRGWDSTYGDKNLARMIDYLKSDKHNGYLRAEVFADIIMRSDKKLVQDMFSYLDGNKDALKDNVHREQYQELLDSLKGFLDTYIASLPEKERAKFTARPLSESLLFVETKDDIGSQALGKMRKISQILSHKREIEENIEEQLMFDEDGVLDTQNAVYVRASKYDKNGKEVDKVYARAEIAAKTNNIITFKNKNGDLSQYVVADPDAKYKVSYTNDKKRYVFTTNLSAEQLLKGEARRENREKLANALRNTVATLANSYASGNFFDSLIKSGRDADGNFIVSEDAEPVYIFENVEELNAYSDAMAKIDGYVPKPYNPDNIPVVGDAVASESRVADTLRVTGSYISFPDNEVIWGDLAGKIVSGPVYSAMHDATNKENMFSGSLARKYNTTVRWFKKSKTVYNPSTIVTNVASNVTLMLAHDIRPSAVAKAAKLLKRYYIDKDLKGADLELMSAFMNSGALLGNFSSQEVKESISLAFAENMYEDKAGVQGIVAQLLGMEKAKAQAYKKHIGNMKDKAAAFDDAAIGFYAYGDNIFRMAAFMNYVGKLQADNGGAPVNKAQLKEAGIAARKMFLDYDIDSRYLQGLRQTIMPFASWTYAIMPVLSKIIVTQPWKLANILGGYAMIDTVASALVGDDDDETRKRMGELYNERLFGIGPYSMIRVPFMGDEQNPVYIKLGNYIPLNSTFKGTPNGTFGIEGWPSGLSPTGPVVTAMAMVFNIDSYTGKEIWGSTDSAYDRMLTFRDKATDIFLPPVIASNARKKYGEAWDGKTGIAGGRNPTTDPTIVALQAFGLKLYQPNTNEEAMWKQLATKKAMREYKTAMSRARREMARSGTYDAEALSAELNRLREDMLEEIDEVVGNN